MALKLVSITTHCCFRAASRTGQRCLAGSPHPLQNTMGVLSCCFGDSRQVAGGSDAEYARLQPAPLPGEAAAARSQWAPASAAVPPAPAFGEGALRRDDWASTRKQKSGERSCSGGRWRRGTAAATPPSLLVDAVIRTCPGSHQPPTCPDQKFGSAFHHANFPLLLPPCSPCPDVPVRCAPVGVPPHASPLRPPSRWRRLGG